MSYYTSLGQEQTPSRRDRARQLYSEGQRAFESADFETALARFEEAYNTYSLPTVLVAIAASQQKLGNLQAAQHAAQRYLYADPSGPNAAQARQIVDATQSKLAPVAPDVPAAVDRPAPALVLPTTADVYDERGSTIGVWVLTGAGVLALVGAGWYFSRPRRVAANRRRRRRSSRRR